MNFQKVFKILVISVISFTGCEKKSDDKYQVDSSIKLEAMVLDDKMQSSNNKIIKGAGKLNIVSATVNAYEKVKQKEQEREEKNFIDSANETLKKLSYENKIYNLLKNKQKTLIRETFVKGHNIKGYLNDDILFGYEVVEQNEKFILYEDDFKKMLYQILWFQNISNIKTDNIVKINDDISIIYNPRKKQYAVILQDKYYYWFDVRKNFFSSLSSS